MIFGDIYLQKNRDWPERVCAEMGIEAVEPLWGTNTEDIMSEFIDAGFQAVQRSDDRALGLDINWTYFELEDKPGDWARVRGPLAMAIVNQRAGRLTPLKRKLTLTLSANHAVKSELLPYLDKLRRAARS